MRDLEDLPPPGSGGSPLAFTALSNAVSWCQIPEGVVRVAESRVEKVGAQLQEEASAFVSYPEIETQSTERGFPTSVRTIRFYVNEGILPPPRKQGNTPVYPQSEILSLLFSIHLMKSRFGQTLSQIRRVLHLLQGDPEILAEKLALLYEEVHRDGRHRVEQEWLVETFFATLEGRSDHYPRSRRGIPGPRSADEVFVVELVEDLEERAKWEHEADGGTVWRSPTEVIRREALIRRGTQREFDRRGEKGRGGLVMSEFGSDVDRNADVTPLKLPEGAVEVDEARRREEQFLRRFEHNLTKLERIYSPLEKKSYTIRPGMLDPQVEDPYQRVVDLLKEKGLYDRALLERLPHDRCTRFSLPAPGLFGRKPPKLVIAGVAVSPIEQLASVGGAVRPLGEPDLARVIREQLRVRGAYHVLGVLSTVGWEEDLFRAPPQQEGLSLVLVQVDRNGGWSTSHTLPSELSALSIAYDPETLDEKVRRAFLRVIDHPELKIPGGHVDVEAFLVEIDLPREVLDLAMRQVSHEDSRLKIVAVSGRDLLKRDRF